VVVFVDNLLVSRATGRLEFDHHPHLGLLSLTEVCRRHGHDAVVFDPKAGLAAETLAYDASLYRVTAQRILDGSPDVVGFTTLGCSFLFAVRVANELKRRRPSLPLILGGPHATILHREILFTFPCFDAVVRYEAEETILPVLDAARTSADYNGIPGVSWRNRSGVCVNEGTPKVAELDSLPDVTSLYPPECRELEWLRIEAGRGCPFHCTFCSTASFFGRAYRLKSPERLAADMDALHRKFGVTRFLLNHDLFTVDRRKVLACCAAIRDKGYTWSCSARIDCVDEPLLEAMHAAGCRRIFFGIETGSQRIQEVCRKRLDLQLLPRILKKTQELGIFAVLSFIAGYPEETLEDLNATLDCLGGYFDGPEHFGVQLHLLTPEPGTHLHGQHGAAMAFDAAPTDFNAVCLDETDQQIIRSHPDIFSTYHFYPTVLPRKRLVFAVELVRTLRLLRAETVEYLLRFFQGKLSVLAQEIYAWCEKDEERGPVEILIFDFVSGRFGPRHHLISLLRYSFGEQNGIAGEHRFGTKNVAANALAFEDIHDWVRLRDGISKTKPAGRILTDDEAGARGSFVVVNEANQREIYAVESDSI